MRSFTVLSAQVRPVPYDPGATFEKFEREVRVAVGAWPDCDLLLFPELYLTGEHPFTGREPEGFVETVAEPVPGPLSERIGKVAQRSGRAILAGTIFESAGSQIFNTALLFDAGGDLVASHRKVFPWRPYERVASGERFNVVDLPGGPRLGLMICYDGWFPEASRSLALRGAEVILQPSLTSTPDREQELILARANAIANQCYVVNVNSSLDVGGGRSIGVDPEGRVLFEGGTGEEFFLEVLDLDRVALVRERGTRGMNKVMKDLRDAPSRLWEGYEDLLRS